MANTGEVKEKKLYVYKFDTIGNHQKKPPPENETAKKKMGWGVLRRSKTVREVVVDHHPPHHNNNIIAAGRLSVSSYKNPPTDYGVEDEKEIVVEGRKSACSEAAAYGHRKSVSHLEVNVGAVASFLQVKILVTDMPGFMQVHAFRCARGTYDSLEKFSPKHMAYNLKKEFDKVYGPAWHCIVGSSFGSFVTHSTGCFLYFSMEKLYILVFKTKVQRTLHQP
ncbi:OLC1v1037123C1 [Oldenlandia corymbosa var. corymbosa]|uniref:OLC1v1037123C1 n=1 Tax=Oldenlandia corymbosa var. corymbosa TaxID=529605 RepID=A0AAV1D0L3_OLDCO|nr:OLC1v1037123C1 [Oldenlandia corymbosa var. corymbosa]